MMTPQSKLDTWVGRHIRAFCDEERMSMDDQLHCAHFVSHCIGLGSSSHAPRSVGAIATQCNNAQQLEHATYGIGPPFYFTVVPKLVFVAKNDKISARNGRIRRIVKPRHVGIFYDQRVWHYENDSRYEKVVSYRIEDKSHSGSKFFDRYGKNCEVWMTDLPPGCSIQTYEEATKNMTPVSRSGRH